MKNKIHITALYCLVAIFTTATVKSQTPFSDGFSAATLNPAWITINSNPSSVVQPTGSGELLLQASALNGGSDLYNGTNNNAPRILQAIDTANHNWTVETKLRFDPNNNYQGAGILIQMSDNPNDSNNRERAAEKKFYPAQGGKVIGSTLGGNYVPYTDSIAYLRCQRTDSIRVYYSANGANWNLLSTSHDLPIFYVGLFCIRQPWDNDFSIDSYTYFDYFNFSNNAPVPVNLTNNYITASSAKCNWTAVFGATQYKLRYRKVGTTAWTTVYSAVKSKTLNGLNSNTQYEWSVKSLVGTTWSAFSVNKKFKTKVMASDKLLPERNESEVISQKTVAVFPNPTNGPVTLNFSSNSKASSELIITDITGRQVMKKQITIIEGENEIAVDLGALYKGIYILRMKATNGEMIKRIVKE